MTTAPALFTTAEVAQRMRKSVRWLQDFLQDHPFYRLAGRTRLFTEDDIAKLINALPAQRLNFAEGLVTLGPQPAIRGTM